MNTPPTTASMDPVTAATSIAAIALSPAIAAIVGHYAVIIVASLIGGAWALGRRQSTSKLSALLFLVLISGTAAMLTTGLAILVARWLPGDDNTASWLVAPIGIAIGAIGHDWDKVGPWLLRRAGRLIDGRIDRGSRAEDTPRSRDDLYREDRQSDNGRSDGEGKP